MNIIQTFKLYDYLLLTKIKSREALKLKYNKKIYSDSNINLSSSICQVNNTCSSNNQVEGQHIADQKGAKIIITQLSESS